MKQLSLFSYAVLLTIVLSCGKKKDADAAVFEKITDMSSIIIEQRDSAFVNEEFIVKIYCKNPEMRIKQAYHSKSSDEINEIKSDYSILGFEKNHLFVHNDTLMYGAKRYVSGPVTLDSILIVIESEGKALVAETSFTQHVYERGVWK